MLYFGLTSFASPMECSFYCYSNRCQSTGQVCRGLKLSKVKIERTMEQPVSSESLKIRVRAILNLHPLLCRSSNKMSKRSTSNLWLTKFFNQESSEETEQTQVTILINLRPKTILSLKMVENRPVMSQQPRKILL